MGYRRIHGELTKLGVTAGQSTVWEILHAAGCTATAHRRRRLGPDGEVIVVDPLVSTDTAMAAIALHREHLA